MKTTNSEDNQAAARFLAGAASLDDAIDQAFSELPRKVRSIIRRWAVQDEPHMHGVPILQKTLAKKCKVSKRTLQRYIAMAHEDNPSFFAILKKYRKQRLNKTGEYDVK